MCVYPKAINDYSLLVMSLCSRNLLVMSLSTPKDEQWFTLCSFKLFKFCNFINSLMIVQFMILYGCYSYGTVVDDKASSGGVSSFIGAG